MRQLACALWLFALSHGGLAQAPSKTAVELDVSYVENGTLDQKFDVYWAPNPHASTVLFIHGGSLKEAGERRSSAPYRDVCRPFVAIGISCASMDYRLAPAYRWPAMPNDVAAAVARLRLSIGARGGDPHKLFLFGHSSGCHLAAVVAADPSYLRSVQLNPSDLAGVIPMGCTLDPHDYRLRRVAVDEVRKAFEKDASDPSIYGTVENLLSNNASRYVGPHMPPTLVVIARDERFAPPVLEQAARFIRQLRQAKVPADLNVVPGDHMSSIAALGQSENPTFAAIRAFILDPVSAGR
jgi:acetyl esterase/lipase